MFIIICFNSHANCLIICLVAGVSVSELSFPDGSAPTQEILDKWLSLVNKEFVGQFLDVRTLLRFTGTTVRSVSDTYRFVFET